MAGSAWARELSPYVLEVDGADHGMYVPGPLARSAEVLCRVATAVEGSLDASCGNSRPAARRPGRRPGPFRWKWIG
jgi:hypothetical protein